MEAISYRQKELRIQFAANVTVLTLFCSLAYCWESKPEFIRLLLIVCFGVFELFDSGSMIYMMYFAQDLRTDERDKGIKSRGKSITHSVLAAGVFLLLWSYATSLFSLSPQHIMEWLLGWFLTARLLGVAYELRLQVGHESWLPDSFVEASRARAFARMERRRRVTK